MHSRSLERGSFGVRPRNVFTWVLLATAKEPTSTILFVLSISSGGSIALIRQAAGKPRGLLQRLRTQNSPIAGKVDSVHASERAADSRASESPCGAFGDGSTLVCRGTGYSLVEALAPCRTTALRRTAPTIA